MNEDTPFDQGRDAFRDDKTVSDNPFGEHTARQAWFKGFKFESDLDNEFEAALNSSR